MSDFGKTLLCLLLSCMAGSAAATPPLSVMSFNIRFDATAGVAADQANAWLATSGIHRRDIALQVAGEVDPDLLCIQEALTNQVEDLQAALPTHGFYGVGRDNGQEAGEYCGVFYRQDRFAAIDQGTFWLNEKSDQPGTRYPKTCCARIASWVLLRDKAAGGREYLLVNTHWDHQIQDARRFSATLIRQRLKTLAAGRPILLAGDLNVSDDNPAFQLLLGSTADGTLALTDSYRKAHAKPQENEGTYHAFRGNTDGNRIDYVLCSDDFQVRSAEIIRTHQRQQYPSDHFPVVVTFIPH